MNRKKNPTKIPDFRYQSLYYKKLQTQTPLSKDINDINHLLQSQISRLHQTLHKRHSPFSRTLKNKTFLQNEETQSRQKLKLKIQEKMLKSHNNKLSFRLHSQSSSKSLLKAQTQRLHQIRKRQRTRSNENYAKSKQISSATEKFFRNLQQQKLNQSKKLTIQTQYLLKSRKKEPLFSPINSNITSNPKQYLYSAPKLKLSSSPSPPIIQSLPQTSRHSSIQQKKLLQQRQKQRSILRDYVQKMYGIEKNRKKIKLNEKKPEPTIPRCVDKYRYSQNSGVGLQKNLLKRTILGKDSYSSSIHSNTKSFDKYEKKSFFLSQSIQKGDDILKQQQKRRVKVKLNKIIKDSWNQLARRQRVKVTDMK